MPLREFEGQALSQRSQVGGHAVGYGSHGVGRQQRSDSARTPHAIVGKYSRRNASLKGLRVIVVQHSLNDAAADLSNDPTRGDEQANAPYFGRVWFSQ